MPALEVNFASDSAVCLSSSSVKKTKAGNFCPLSESVRCSAVEKRDGAGSGASRQAGGVGMLLPAPVARGYLGVGAGSLFHLQLLLLS